LASPDRYADVAEGQRAHNSGDSAGLTQAAPEKVKTMRTRRNAAFNGLSDKRHIYAVAAGCKLRSELALLDSAGADVTWQDFASGQDFLRAAGNLSIGCVLVNDPLPDMESLALVSWLGQQRADLACVVVSSQPTVKSAVDCLKAGAHDYIGAPIDKAVAAAALQSVFAPPQPRPDRASALARLRMTSRLSNRELQVLEALLGGMSNKAVGAKLQISERTVEVHRSRIMRRLNVESFAELVRMSVQAGLGAG
jgi:two-component system, LuxR family, response regulator FixJ